MSARRLPHTAGVVVPLRSFAYGKARLADTLDDDTRRAFARTMAERVVASAGSRPVVIVSSAPEVVSWARTLGVAQVNDPGTLDLAADAGRVWIREQRLVRLIVMHADLPLATSVDGIADDGAQRVAVIVPDHHDDGNPVLAIPSDADFRFAYGTGSCARHIAEAGRCGLDVRVVRDRALGFDVDDASDFEALTHDRETTR
ncbi:MAG TPA: 2-phospho-L-lactate guanylyltransferase [Acidimicrobiia bacterium]|nr:2-phospho-L-lactate guanylyltransferase [Acidimicrobiia bacterium]